MVLYSEFRLPGDYLVTAIFLSRLSHLLDGVFLKAVSAKS